jgi:hypothetical protein
MVYKASLQNTPCFLWNIALFQPTFAILSKAGYGPLAEGPSLASSHRRAKFWENHSVRILIGRRDSDGFT